MQPNNNTALAILQSEHDEIKLFIHEWQAVLKQGSDAWMAKLDPCIQIVAGVYQYDMARLLHGHNASGDWAETLESAKLLRAATWDLLIKLRPAVRDAMFLSEPKPIIEEKTAAFLVAAMYHFDASLRELRKTFPPKGNIVVQTLVRQHAV